MQEITKQNTIAGNGLDFEQPLIELENQIARLKQSKKDKHIDITRELAELRAELDAKKRRLYNNLTPWQKVQIARHPNRPLFLDLVGLVFDTFVELHGDRCFGDDKALVGGLATMGRQKLMVIGQQKGKDTSENIMRNFGSPHPEGYRKAIRLMRLAEKFQIPVISFIDTPGAYPGIGAEERGQAQAIAHNLKAMMGLRTPVIIIITGEGCSGGALGIGVGDIVVIFEHGYYSVISPEGCAAILWKDSTKMAQAADTLRLTAEELLNQKIVDEIIPEPLGGAHRDYFRMGATLKRYILRYLRTLKEISQDELLEKRYRKFRNYGVFIDKAAREMEPASVTTNSKDEDETKHVPFPHPYRQAK